MLLPGLTRIDLTTAYHRFSLVLLDEATSALDIATEAKLLEALRALAGKLTIVMVAHRLSALANCVRLVDLSNETGQDPQNTWLEASRDFSRACPRNG